MLCIPEFEHCQTPEAAARRLAFLFRLRRKQWMQDPKLWPLLTSGDRPSWRTAYRTAIASGLTPTLGFFSNLSEIGAAKPGQILISPRVFMAVEDAVTVEPVGEFTLKASAIPFRLTMSSPPHRQHLEVHSATSTKTKPKSVFWP